MNQFASVEPGSNEKEFLIKKELVFRSFDESIQTVYVGFLPPVGRYFRKQMKQRDKQCFELEVMLPRGTTFYHYFFNENFEVPRNNGSVLQYDPHQRSVLVLETPIFCPVQFVNEPNFVSHIIDNIWEFRVITHQAWIKQVGVIIGSETYELSAAFTDKSTSFWAGRIRIVSEHDFFCIKATGLEQEKFLHKDLRLRDDPSLNDFFSLPVVRKKKQEAAVFLKAGYQILPDRFSRAQTGINHPGIETWGSVPRLDSFFGGNLQGITTKLEYIGGLGVDFIYLNPIFFSRSYHRYDCTDYYLIDPLLGTEADLKELINKAHKLNIKVVFDICFNHCSVDFFAFNDILINQEQSKYRKWFEIEKFPVKVEYPPNYSSWHGIKELPQFNLNENEVVEYFIKIARYWTENFEIDGWRLDVCTELPSLFIKKFMAAARAINPAIVIIGETWQNQLLSLSADGDIDGITNYSFYLDALVPFFEQEAFTLSKLALAIMKSQSQHAFRTNCYSWNFLSNHDIPRFYSILKDKRKYLLAFTLLYALPGTPVIYYGEELHLEGLTDPDNRRCMPLDHAIMDQQVVEAIKILNALKSQYTDVLIHGSLAIPFVCEESKLLVIQRFFGEEHLCFIFNFDDKTHKYILPAGIDSLQRMPGSNGAGKAVVIPPYKAGIVYFKSSTTGKSPTSVKLFEAESTLLE